MELVKSIKQEPVDYDEYEAGEDCEVDHRQEQMYLGGIKLKVEYDCNEGASCVEEGDVWKVQYKEETCSNASTEEYVDPEDSTGPEDNVDTKTANWQWQKHGTDTDSEDGNWMEATNGICHPGDNWNGKDVKKGSNHKRKPGREKDYSPNVLMGKKAVKTSTDNESAEYKCEKCDLICKSRKTLKAHQGRCKMGSKEGFYMCHICQENGTRQVFTSVTRMLLHKWKIHNIDEKPYQCEVCRKTFRTPLDMKHHRRIHEPTTAHECHLCDKSFRYSKGLRTHLQNVHQLSGKYNCTICGKQFVSETFYNKHMSMPHDEMACEVCGKVFTEKANLSVHMRNHTFHPYMCSHCKKGYSSKHLLEQHQRLHAVRDYNCQECGYGFESAKEYRKHMQRHTQVRKHQCKICNKLFVSNTQMREHVASVHEKKRPHSCEMCETSFSTLSSLRRHQRNKHRVSTLHKCLICGQGFPTKLEEKKHREMHE